MLVYWIFYFPFQADCRKTLTFARLHLPCCPKAPLRHSHQKKLIQLRQFTAMRQKRPPLKKISSMSMNTIPLQLLT